MLCLSPALHSWWSRGYFAFRYLGITPTEDAGGGTVRGIVHIQLHWLPRQTTAMAATATMPTTTPTTTQYPRPWDDTVKQDKYCDWIREWESRPRFGSPADANMDADGDPIVAVPHPATSRLLQTGHVFTVTLPSMDEAQKMAAMLELQWACLQIASMSGAAGDDNFLYEGDDEYGRDEDEGQGQIYTPTN
ncbi:hypothetical protein SPBR_03860 [Sporothrix brasiliensis 5110]|uniref:HNH nuclease domain-containing protein n=1 Tax=Sporothrix brasiliensis 5110 TaxID=1398154 RepID=A0A0C2J7B6_9PEZI|nr:uncharacterized protein SPBR_03860 [Sporothrix brasiliensis 5110]KIH94885.1 hypothetical protein SPBR_03860 [Sporothrix brasiliensis 5110]